MATALAKGWIASSQFGRENCLASDPVTDCREQFTSSTGAAAIDDNCRLVEQCEIVVLAVKPVDVGPVLGEIREALLPDHLVISIAAGVRLKELAEGLGRKRRVVRVMPNVACLVQAGAFGYAANDRATANDLALVDRLFNAIGLAIAVPEDLLDAVTGLSGSGPAYVAIMVEALSDGGVLMGLPRDVATELSIQTLLGSVKMMQEADFAPAELKEQVASPGGTTIAGIHALERGGLRSALMDAVAAATRRAKELGSSQ